MPFGLSSAPSCFQKIMVTIFAGIPGVVVYLDDIVVYGATSSLRDDRLSKVLDVLARHNLTLNGEKCIFAASVIEFVGFRLTATGLSPLHRMLTLSCVCLNPPALCSYHHSWG